MSALSPLLRQATPVHAVRGEGMYLFDQDDRRYLDFTAGIGVTSTGHCHPAVVEAAQRQVATLIHGQYTTVLHPLLGDLADAITDRLPDGLDSVFFANAGSEAVEAAMRIARTATGRPNVVVFQGGFHGRTAGAASLTTSKLAVRSGAAAAGVAVAPFPHARRYGWDTETTVAFCLRELDFLFQTVTGPEDTAAIFIEPVLGEGGYVPVPDAFLAGLRERCDRHGILLVADEIQTGVGRTGRFWGMDHSGVRPDIVTTAKGLASGFPISACVASSEVMGAGRPGSQGGTYGGNAVACAAALATLRVVDEEGLVGNAADVGGYLLDRCRELGERHPAIDDVRGRGLMIGLELAGDGPAAPGPSAGATAAAVLAEAAAQGLLTLTCGPSGEVLRLIPPLIVERGHADEAVAILDDALTKVQAAR